MSSTVVLPHSPPEPPRSFGAPTFHTDGDILAIGIASDGILWSIEEPGELRGWSLATRRLVVTKPLDSFSTLWTFNWAARLLASASDELTIWEVASGKALTTFPSPEWITAVSFQPGAAIVATGDESGAVRVWDWSKQKMLLELEAHPDHEISAVAFSLDQRKLATAGEDKLIHLWDLRSGKKLGTLTGHKDRIPALAWHPDHRRLFSAGWDTTVRVWDTEKREPIILLNSHANEVHVMALSADGKTLASADSRNDVHLWDTDESRSLAIVREAKGEVRHLTFTPDDGRGDADTALLAFGSADRVIHLWDSRTGSGGSGVDPIFSRTTIAVSPEGNRLYSVGGGTDLRVWDVVSGNVVGSLEDEPILRTAVVSPCGKFIAASHADDVHFALYDAKCGKWLRAFEGQTGPITSLAFSPDSATLASGSVRASDVWLWNVGTAKPFVLLNGAMENCAVETLVFHPNGTLLAVSGIDHMATSGEDGQVVIWDVAKRQVTHELRVLVKSSTQGTIEQHTGATALAFHPTEHVLACASLDRSKTIRLWNFSEDSIVASINGHSETVTCLAFSPDGEWLASGSDDNSLRLWNGKTGEAVGAWNLSNPIKALCFSPDGRWIFTGNGNTSCYQIEVSKILNAD